MTMSEIDIASCLKCNMTFATHDELFIHSCAQIKLENDELQESSNYECVFCKGDPYAAIFKSKEGLAMHMSFAHQILDDKG